MHPIHPIAGPRHSAERISSRRAFTLTELLTVIAIIGVLAAILFPVVGKVRAASHNSACAANLRQIGVAMNAYCAENRDALPGYELIQDDWQLAYGLNRGAGPTYWMKNGKPTRDLCAHLAPYLGVNTSSTSTGTVKSFICPAAAAEQGASATGYYLSTAVRLNDGTLRRPIGLINGPAAERRSIKRMEMASPSRAVALYDADNTYLPLIGQSAVSGAPATAAHSQTRNVLYFDGHVASVGKDVNPQEKL